MIRKKKFLVKPTELWVLIGKHWEISERTTPFGIVMHDGTIIDWKEVDLR